MIGLLGLVPIVLLVDAVVAVVVLADAGLFSDNLIILIGRGR